ncbi:TRAP transporter small permease [Acidimangrovimonas sediminis]|uniref:TRAP transporter small permease n=1 Tax=Acidimangrovimonas sediminis TaxID=2056283 RepID=UPI000C800965|nr:TRAP transporter small permease [Acidimangrovimonas sediminis]
MERGPLLAVATLMFLGATGIMLAEAFSRAFLDRSYFWAEEAVRFLIVWAFFLSLGAAGRGGYHIRTDLVVAVLSRRMRIVCGCLAALVGLAFSVILFDGSVQQVLRYHAMGMLSESNLELPMWIVFLAMPVGAVLFAIYYLRLLVHGVSGNDPFAFGDLDEGGDGAAAGADPTGKF